MTKNILFPFKKKSKNILFPFKKKSLKTYYFGRQKGPGGGGGKYPLLFFPADAHDEGHNC